jgi:anti-sigma factor RsiW
MIRRTPARQPSSKKAGITCREVTDLILDYVTGELNAETALAFKAHLRKCPDCIAFLSTYQKTVQATQSLRYEILPLEVRKRARQFLRERIKRPLP